MCGSMVDIQSVTTEGRRKKREKNPQRQNTKMAGPIGRP